MSYPWFSFGAITFTPEESIILDSDSLWNRDISLSRARPIGAARDDVQVLAIGSEERQFELYLSAPRLDALKALVGTTATFTDQKKPIPDTRSAFLAKLTAQESVTVRCSDGSTERRIRTRVELVSQ